MGEAKLKIKRMTEAMAQAIGVETSGGRIHVRWDADAETTPFGQIVFILETAIESQ